MTFEQVLPALKNGEFITRKGQWGKDRYFYRDDSLGIAECNESGGGEWQFEADDLLADDWYIIGSHNETILPRPVIRDGNGKLIKDHTPRDFFLKLQEEIFEVMESAMNHIYSEFFAEEIADVITVCISYLNAIGYDEKKRSELFAKVNEKNEKRGYFEEKTTKIFSEKEIKSCIERLQDLVRDRQSFLTGEADHDEVFLKDIHFLEMAMTLLEMKEMYK